MWESVRLPTHPSVVAVRVVWPGVRVRLPGPFCRAWAPLKHTTSPHNTRERHNDNSQIFSPVPGFFTRHTNARHAHVRGGMRDVNGTGCRRIDGALSTPVPTQRSPCPTRFALLRGDSGWYDDIRAVMHTPTRRPLSRVNVKQRGTCTGASRTHHPARPFALAHPSFSCPRSVHTRTLGREWIRLSGPLSPRHILPATSSSV